MTEPNRVNVEAVAELGERVRSNVSKVLVGKEEAVDLALVALLSEGHVLAEDVPGVGKTMLARSLASSIGCTFQRIQFTPDLLPSDVTGVSIYNQKSGEFEFRPGPAVTQILLADEINRATPRTQSSLLECMAERQITVDGVSRPLPRPFFVIATQNPVEYEGTFPLPEAQLDRFFLRIRLGYPSADEELEILRRLQHGRPIDELKQVAESRHVLEAQSIVRSVYVEDSVRDYIVALAAETRRHADAALGASPRGTLALFRAAQALAALHGRDFATPDDVKRLAVPVLSHRLIMKPESELRGRSSDSVVEELLSRVPIHLEDELEDEETGA